jgi:hypothetical protein
LKIHWKDTFQNFRFRERTDSPASSYINYYFAKNGNI